MKTNKLIAAALLPLLFSCAKENIEPSTDPVSDGKYVTVNLVPDEDSITKVTYDDNIGITWTTGEYYAGIINTSGDNLKSKALDKVYDWNGNMQASFKFLQSELSGKTGPYILYYPYHYYAEYTDGKYKIPQYVDAVQTSGIGLSSESLAVVSKKAIQLTQLDQTEYDNNGAEVSFKVVGSYIRLLVYGGNKEDEKIDYIRIHDLKGENCVAGTYYVSVSVDGENNSTIQLGDGSGDLYNEIILNFVEKPATKIDRADAKGIYAQVRQGKHQLAYEIHTKVGDVKYTYIFKYPKETDFAFSSIKDIPLNIAKATATVENIPEELYIVGDVSFVGWNHNNAIKMDKNGYIFTKDVYLNTKVKKDGSYSDAEGFKFLLQNTSFDPAYVNGGDNTLAYYNGGDSNKDIKFTVNESGYYTVTADFSTGEVTCTPKAPEKFYVWGDATTAGWDSKNAIQLTKSTENEFIFSIENIPLRGNKEFKFFSEDSESTAYVSDEYDKLVFFDSPSGSVADRKFKVKDDGIYSLTVNLNDKSVTCSEPSLPKVYTYDENKSQLSTSMIFTELNDVYKAKVKIGQGVDKHDFKVFYNGKYYHVDRSSEVNKYQDFSMENNWDANDTDKRKDNLEVSWSVISDTEAYGWYLRDDLYGDKYYDISLDLSDENNPQVKVKLSQGTKFYICADKWGNPIGTPGHEQSINASGVVKWENIECPENLEFNIKGENDNEYYFSTNNGSNYGLQGFWGDNYNKNMNVQYRNGDRNSWQFGESGHFDIEFDTKNLTLKVTKR